MDAPSSRAATAVATSAVTVAPDFEQELRLPAAARGIVVIVATKLDQEDGLTELLHEAGIGTLNVELDPPPAGYTTTRALQEAITRRVLAAGDWLAGYAAAASLPIGLFGRDEAAGAVLAAAALRPQMFRAVVSRAARPELAGSALDQVQAATLLIVAGHDAASIADHQEAMTRVRGIAELEVLPRAGDALGERETSAQVARLTRRWFARFLA